MPLMALTQYYTATTLDGFIADPDNSLDWLFTRQQEPDGPLNYRDFVAGVGALAMGSTTYQWILNHEFADKNPAEWKWPYDIPCWVFTHRKLAVVPDAHIEFTSADVASVHQDLLRAAGDRNVWVVGGGDLAGQFADAGLLDEVIVYIAPVTLGAGAPLLPRGIELRLEELARNGDFACARYSVVHHLPEDGSGPYFGCSRAPPSSRTTSAFMYGFVRSSSASDANSSAVPSRGGKRTSCLRRSLNAAGSGALS
jgi:dihydrofolate reductase